MNRESLRRRKRVVGWLSVLCFLLAMACVPVLAGIAAMEAAYTRHRAVRFAPPAARVAPGRVEFAAPRDQLARELADLLSTTAAPAPAGSSEGAAPVQPADPQKILQDWVLEHKDHVLFALAIDGKGRALAAFPNEQMLKSLTFDIAGNVDDGWEPAMDQIEEAGLPHPEGNKGTADYIDPASKSICYVLLHTKPAAAVSVEAPLIGAVHSYLGGPEWDGRRLLGVGWEGLYIGLACTGGFFWVLCVIFAIWWVALDARYRGMRRGWLLALFCFLTMPVGLLIYLIVRPDEPEPCPSCGRLGPAGFSVCPWCGARLRGVCPKCKAAVEKGWRLCPYCQTPLVAPTAQAPSPKEQAAE